MAIRSKPLRLGGWGRFPMAEVAAFRPERQADIAPCLLAAQGGVIARGGGRSYGDQAINQDGSVLLTTRLDRLVSFDDATGLLVAEPGVTFATLLEVFLPRGYLVPVSPGTSYATLGGAVANDVHGKNHDRQGSFGDHVQWLDVMLPDGTERRIDDTTEPELFAATIGGGGMTGIILRLALRLMKVPSNAVRLREQRAPDLDHFLSYLDEARRSETFSVGWIDALARGAALGRGIVETAEFSAEGVPEAARRNLRIPFNFPSIALNPVSVRAFNGLYYSRVPAAGRERLCTIAKFLYPLDAIADWNRIYGARGFQQFQCVLPDDQAPAGLRRLLEAVSAAGAASFLAVLKTLGGPGRGMLSFPMKGFTLALDFPRRAGSDALLANLERITLDYGGRIYLAKDSALSPTGLTQMYPELSRFRRVLAELDPQGRMTSDMARRLGLAAIRGPS